MALQHPLYKKACEQKQVGLEELLLYLHDPLDLHILPSSQQRIYDLTIVHWRDSSSYICFKESSMNLLPFCKK